MRLIIITIVVTALLTGCGYDPEQPVYDTAANPHQFPAASLALIDGIESGTLNSYDQIVSRFADLYTAHSDLLDSPKWKEVIDRLGKKFQARADQAAAAGMEEYDKAAGLYLLASFAQPTNSQLQQTSSLFATWLSESKRNSAGRFKSVGSLSGSQLVDLLRLFELGDSLHRAFSEQFLRKNILASFNSADLWGKLGSTQKALLKYAGLEEIELDQPLTEFDDPSIVLVAGEVRPIAENWYQVDLYFEAKSKIEGDFTIALHAMSPDELPISASSQQNFIPFDFDPIKPTSEWTAGSLVATAKQIYYEGEPNEIRVGLYRRPHKESSMAHLHGLNQSMFGLQVSRPITSE